jgi:Flp pilus assembly protein TadB
MEPSLAVRAQRRQVAQETRGSRRRQVAAAVRRGEAVDDPADAGLAVLQAAEELRRLGRRGTLLPFGRDFALVVLAAAAVVLLTDTSWTARAGMLLLTLGVLLVAELAIDFVLARRRENAARAERENLALIVRSVATRYPGTGRDAVRSRPPSAARGR